MAGNLLYENIGMGLQKEPNELRRVGTEGWFLVQGGLSDLSNLKYMAFHSRAPTQCYSPYVWASS